MNNTVSKVKPEWNFYTPKTRPAAEFHRREKLERALLGLKEFGTQLSFDTSKYDDFWMLFRIYTEMTDEKPVVFQKLRDRVLEARWEKNGRLLDIGPGDGMLTQMLAKHFSESVLVERSTDNAAKLNDIFNTAINRNIKVVAGNFPQDAKGEKADFAYMGHMLYFQPHAEWMGTIQAAYGQVKEGGKLAVTMHGDLGQVSDMVEAFGGKRNDIGGLALACMAEFGADKVGLHAVQTRHYTATPEGMRAILGFFLLDTDANYTEGQMRDYINTFLKVDMGFQITKYDQTIVVHK